MYGIDIFDEIKMPLDWSMIYYGISIEQLNLEAAQEFAGRKLECSQQLSEDELELLWKTDDREKVLELIKKVLGQKNSESISGQTKEKVCVALVIALRTHIKNMPALLEKMDMLYAAIGYPREMEGFVSYMPAQEPDFTKNISQHERYMMILKKIDSFIDQKAMEYGLETIL